MSGDGANVSPAAGLLLSTHLNLNPNRAKLSIRLPPALPVVCTTSSSRSGCACSTRRSCRCEGVWGRGKWWRGQWRVF